MKLFSKKNAQKNTNKKISADNQVTKESKPLTEEIKTSVISTDIVENISTLKNTSNSMSSSFNDILNSTSSISDTFLTESETLSKASKNIQSFNQNMQTLSNNVTNVQVTVNKTDSLSSEGINSIEKLDVSLKDLQTAFTDSSSTVNELVSKLESVNSITDSISQIATQTNLLSLNAAIEAARAGEAGKGFSVVAGEVGKLAENSKQAVQSITSILNEIKKDIINASNSMNQGNDAISIQQSTISETKNSFENIKSSISETTSQINTCLGSLNTANQKSTEIYDEIDSAISLSQSNASIVKEFTDAITNKSREIEGFNSSISELAEKITN